MIDIKTAGENALIIYFGQDRQQPHQAEQLLDEITFYTDLLKQELATLLIDVIPSYTSIMLTYRLALIDESSMKQQIQDIIKNNTWVVALQHNNTVDIPVFYDQDVAPDLLTYLTQKQLSLDTLITLHTAKSYRVYAVGFSPVFAYLGHVDPKLTASRLTTPRQYVPAGSVGIADSQTAIYPVDSAGGWQIIGRTPVDLSLANPDNINRFQVGDHVRFRAIDMAEYIALGGQR